MSPNGTPKSSSSPLASTRRSLFSRFTSPLKARTRNLTDFHIKPLEPHRQYAPGDLVKGAVVLTVLKPIRITHLTVCLHGFVRVFKSPNGANEPPTDAGLTGSSSSRKTQYFGNGHASLFQDELTLCGEGRLDAGVYEFNFELEFPKKDLPTSIDFERGTISYMITSTITRPTSIAATTSCDQKVALVETVDIGPLTPPKPRTISLEPISRRSRRKKAERIKQNASHDTLKEGIDTRPSNEGRQMSGSPLPDESVSQYGDAENMNNPRSPVESEMLSTVSAVTGTESSTSSSTGLSFRLGPVPSSSKTISHASGESASDKTITATIELLKPGCLPGEALPLKVSIKHSKAIKSMHGIIITLYRQGRIDSAPPLSLFVDIKGKEAERLKHEEYYPKSKTGLGGLSLTSAGSSSVFRKDLAQTFAPILVDPVTLTAVVNASVRVPEDAFPTISGVPGEMISFKYHVEVVVDLGGKLAGQQRHVPRVGTITLPSSFGAGAARGDASSNMLTAMEGSIVDTDHIRREKSVVGCLFEVVVGSTDSARKRGRGNSVRMQGSEWQDTTIVSPVNSYHHDPIYEEPSARDEQPYPYQYYDEGYGQQDWGEYAEEPPPIEAPPPPAHPEIHVPPPMILPEESLGEKERLRMAEQRLLPSQPPQDGDAGPSSPRTIIPTPILEIPTTAGQSPSHDDLYDAEDPPYPPRYPLVDPLGPSAPPMETATAAPSAPTLEDLAPVGGARATDDKQELERRRMLAEASAPSDFPDDEQGNGEGGSRLHGENEGQHAPSVPVLNEEEEEVFARSFEVGGGRAHEEALPKYER
ncbi:hypothetical protein B0O99DRAFT_10027 [Bisporella sp. PMI_857]|nr:hypothetical protein B0O99DRAFT_10027 [Bisporella sp. PMI_857]